MPHCESCNTELSSKELFTEVDTRKLICQDCGVGKVVELPQGNLILGREFDYDFSYSRKEGLKASANLGKASITLHIPQEELVKVLG